MTLGREIKMRLLLTFGSNLIFIYFIRLDTFYSTREKLSTKFPLPFSNETGIRITSDCPSE